MVEKPMWEMLFVQKADEAPSSLAFIYEI